MLVRKQVLLEEKQVLDLQELAALANVSVSKMLRLIVPHGIKVEKAKVVTKKKVNKQYEAIDKWIANPVKGPGNSEYDKYAYDL